MKLSAEAKSQFQICILSHQIDFSSRLRTTLAQDGFSVFLLSDEEQLFQRLPTDPPHVVVVGVESLGLPVEKFAAQIARKNSEVLLIVYGTTAELLRLKNFFDSPVFLTIPVADGQFPSAEIISKNVSVACAHLVDLYRSEQVYSELKEVQNKLKNAQETLHSLSSSPKSIVSFDLAKELQNFKACVHFDELLSLFFERAKDLLNTPVSGIYFRYVPASSALIPVASLGVKIEKLQGFGVPVKNQADPLSNLWVKDFLFDVLRVRSFSSFPISVLSHPEGQVVFWGSETLDSGILQNLAVLLEQTLENRKLHSELRKSNKVDPVSGLGTMEGLREFYHVELERSKRHEICLSVIEVRLDQLAERQWTSVYEKIYLKKWWDYLTKSSRIYDRVFFQSTHSVYLILPHTAGSSALIRTERLREFLEKKSVSLWGEPMTCSCSVVEVGPLNQYPNWEQVALQLTESVSSLQQEGGNKASLVSLPLDDLISKNPSILEA